MTEPNKSLIRGVVRLHDKASGGDPAAREQLRSISAAAAEGDMSAVTALNTLAVVRFAKKNPRAFAKAGAMFKLIEQKDPAALKWALEVQNRAKAGDPRARRILGMLNAHKDKDNASAWATPTDSEEGNTRARNTPMTFGRSFRPAVAGADAVASVKKFLRMTSEDERRLTAMMLRGAASRGVNPATEAAITAAMAAERAAPSQTLSQQLQVTARKPATGTEIEAYKAAVTNWHGAGMSIVAMNPGLEENRSKRTQGADWDRGYYTGVAVSMGNSQSGPGQEKIRTELTYDTPNEPMRSQLKLKGFDEARATMYQMTLSRAPLFLPPTAVAATGRLNLGATSQFTGMQSDCDAAAAALARNSPAAPGLIAKCAAARRTNVMAGFYIADALSPNDPAYRVALTDAGNVVIAKNPKMAEFRSQLPLAQQRGFTMSMGVRAGQVDPRFVAFVTPALAGDPELLRGFLDGMNM